MVLVAFVDALLPLLFTFDAMGLSRIEKLHTEGFNYVVRAGGLPSCGGRSLTSQAVGKVQLSSEERSGTGVLSALRAPGDYFEG